MERSRRRAHNRQTLLLLPYRQHLLRFRLEESLTYLEKLYVAIVASSGKNVVVDSSKSLLYGYVLGVLPAIDLYLVHIVRDPRGVAYSLKKRKERGMPQFHNWNPMKATLTWNGVNLTREMSWSHSSRPYLRLRYEDFVRELSEGAERMIDLVGEKATPSSFVDGRHVNIRPTHNVGGNAAARFQSGEITLRPDEGWRRGLSRADRAVVTASTWPLLLHYGYDKQ